MATSSSSSSISSISKCIEIIQSKLYFQCIDDVSSVSSLHNNDNTISFVMDSELIYTAFFADFGPLHLGLTYKFCQQLDEQLKKASLLKKSVTFYISKHPHTRSNAGVLVCAYLIFVLNYTAEQAYKPFIGIKPAFIPFRDAAFAINTYPITVLDCARAMHKAASLGHFNYKEFNLQSYTSMSQLQNGDFSWIIPNKFVAFSGPIANKKREISSGVYTLNPEEYIPLFRKLGVKCIIRFNSKCYDRTVYTSAGIKHVDLYYEDGGNPTENILQSFLQICENEKGAFAVHCKAGLGRTGTNIAAYMIKHYNYSAKETIAWCRICRPGSVVGPQQQFLSSIEEKLKREGEQFRAFQSQMQNQNLPHDLRREYSMNSASTATTNSSFSTSLKEDNRSLTPPLVVSNGLKKQTNNLFKSIVSKDKVSQQSRPSTSSSDLRHGNKDKKDDMSLMFSNSVKIESSSSVRASESGNKGQQSGSKSNLWSKPERPSTSSQTATRRRLGYNYSSGHPCRNDLTPGRLQFFYI